MANNRRKFVGAIHPSVGCDDEERPANVGIREMPVGEAPVGIVGAVNNENGCCPITVVLRTQRSIRAVSLLKVTGAGKPKAAKGIACPAAFVAKRQ